MIPTGMGALPADPVFVVGYPRSGTTLLQALIASMPGYLSFPETHFFSVVRGVIDTGPDGAVEPGSLPAAAAVIAERTGCRMGDAEAARLARLADSGSLTVRDLFEWQVGRLLEERYPAERLAAPYRWVEKTPMHLLNLDEIHSCYPEAAFVAIHRHPVAAIASRRRAFPGGVQDVGKLARQWEKGVLAVEAFGAAHPGRLLTVRYEDLAADPASALAQVASFLGVGSFDPAWLEGYRDLVGALVHPWETWKEGVTGGEIRDGNRVRLREVPLWDLLAIQSRLGGLMRRYGYPIRHPRLQSIRDTAVRFARRLKR